jgi:HEAT repeat protein
MRLLLLLVVLFSGAAQAADSGKDRVVALLSVIHELPQKSVFEAASKDARDVVLSIATDPSVNGPQRARALQALAYWPDAAAFDAHRTALGDERLRHKALRLLGATFGAQSLPTIAAYLDHPDAQLRATALEAAADVKGSQAEAMLAQRAAVEPIAWIKARLVRAQSRQATTNR